VRLGAHHGRPDAQRRAQGHEEGGRHDDGARGQLERLAGGEPARQGQEGAADGEDGEEAPQGEPAGLPPAPRRGERRDAEDGTGDGPRLGDEEDGARRFAQGAAALDAARELLAVEEDCHRERARHEEPEALEQARARR